MSNSIMIIGAGPGIGQSVAERFGAEGWRVVLPLDQRGISHWKPIRGRVPVPVDSGAKKASS